MYLSDFFESIVYISIPMSFVCGLLYLLSSFSPLRFSFHSSASYKVKEATPSLPRSHVHLFIVFVPWKPTCKLTECSARSLKSVGNVLLVLLWLSSCLSLCTCCCGKQDDTYSRGVLRAVPRWRLLTKTVLLLRVPSHLSYRPGGTKWGGTALCTIRRHSYNG